MTPDAESEAPTPYLVVLETSANQRYIFATNRLHQNVGASELLLRAGSQWVLEAVAEVGGPRGLWDESTEARVARLRNAEANPPLSVRHPVEVVLATSGYAVLLVRDDDLGREIVCRVTRRALLEAPGLAIAGAMVPARLGDRRANVHTAIREGKKALGRVRGRLTVTETRFRHLPIVDYCRTTGLPASVYETPLGSEEPEELSLIARSKYRAAAQTSQRMGAETLIRLRNHLIESPRHLDACEWLGVVHADANGMGALLGSLRDMVGAEEDHVRALRDFSTVLELIAVEAFNQALWQTAKGLEERGDLRHEPIPLVPLVVGGDDLTVVCDGRLALPFTMAYLRAFEQRSEAHLGERLAGRKRTCLTAAAGAVLVKRHYPLHAAYDLAEDLTESAKLTRHYDDRSSFDFHVHVDSGGSDLSQVRRDRRSRDEREDEQVALWGGPYVVDVPDDAEGWLRAHAVERLRDAVQLLRCREDGQRVLPASAAHRLRSALAEGRSIADAELARLLPRLDPRHRPAVLALGEGESVVRREGKYRTSPDDPHRDDAPVHATAFVDAMEASDLWKTEAG